MAESEPSLVSVNELPEATQLTTVELDPPEEDTQRLLSEEEHATEENDGDQPIQKEWRIESRLSQRKAKWYETLRVILVVKYRFQYTIS